MKSMKIEKDRTLKDKIPRLGGAQYDTGEQWRNIWGKNEVQFSSVQSLSHVRLFATPRTPARQASLSITNSQSLLKLMSVESGMPSNHLILCLPLISLLQSSPASESFQMSQFFASGSQNIGAPASALILTMNIQNLFPLGLTGWISLLSKGLSRVLSNSTVQKHQWCSQRWRKNEVTEKKQKQHPVADVTGDGSKIWCSKINVNWKWSNRRWQEWTLTF